MAQLLFVWLILGIFTIDTFSRTFLGLLRLFLRLFSLLLLFGLSQSSLLLLF